MYTGTLAAASNRADLQFTCEVVDPTTGADIDLTSATISVAIRPQDQSLSILSATSADGSNKVTITGLGTFQVWFTPSDMKQLIAGLYDIGITILMPTGITFQLIAGVLPVVDGVIDA
jgi:hypothetical protein